MTVRRVLLLLGLAAIVTAAIVVPMPFFAIEPGAALLVTEACHSRHPRL